jgi:hypothetical protein
VAEKIGLVVYYLFSNSLKSKEKHHYLKENKKQLLPKMTDLKLKYFDN